MKYELTLILSRIAWCRDQQQLHTLTEDDRAGWRAEEAGLRDALGLRDRRDVMKEEHASQWRRYQCGLEDGRVLLRIDCLPPVASPIQRDRTQPCPRFNFGGDRKHG
jgi:hypothetical protein